MKHHSKTFRRVRIFVLWLVCMIVFNFALFNVIRTQKYDRAREDLAVQAKIVSGHLPSIIENDMNSQAGRDLFTDKMKSLAFVLEKRTTPKRQERSPQALSMSRGWPGSPYMTGKAMPFIPRLMQGHLKIRKPCVFR